jgi:gas vesicle protein
MNKQQLDFWGTLLGAVAGISAVLTTNGVIDVKLGGTIGGIATVLLGVVVQRPTSSSPTTEDLEEKK